MSETDKPIVNNDKKRLNYLLSAMQCLTGNDPASLYLKSRKIYSKSLSRYDIGFINSQKYYDENGKVTGEYPVMISNVRDSHGETVTLQLTYLTEGGKKAPVPKPKKIISKLNGKPCGVYSFGFEKMGKSETGIVEGVEDAISASILYKMPVVGVIGTSGVENFMPVKTTKYLTAFIQRDEKFQGQAASFKMLKTLSQKTDLKLDWVMSIKEDFNDDILNKGETK